MLHIGIIEGQRCCACGAVKPVEESKLLCLICFDFYLLIEARKRLLARRFKQCLLRSAWSRTL